MKRFLKIVVFIGLFALLLNISVSAEEYSGTHGENVEWVFDDATGILTISGNGYMPEVDYSSDVPWYEYRKSIEKVVIGDNITNIGEMAFASCSNLTEVKLGADIAEIGSMAFSYCSALSEIELPEKITYIPSSGFMNCKSLKAIKLPGEVKTIGTNAFNGCTSLESIEMSENITYVGENAFSNCTNLKYVNIKNIEKWCAVTFKSAGSSPFLCGADLYVDGNRVENLVINNIDTLDSKQISDYAFYGCGSIKKLTIGGKVEAVKRAFSTCGTLESVTIGESVKSIDGGAFAHCNALKTVSIAGGISEIGMTTFRGCSSLEKIEIPQSVTKIGLGAFLECSSLSDIYFGGSKEDWENMTVEQYNDVFENAAVHYNSQMQKKVSVSYTYDNGNLIIKAENLAEEVIIVKGTKGGIDTVRVPECKSGEDIMVDIGAGYDGLKIMIWNSFNDMEPACEAIVVH